VFDPELQHDSARALSCCRMLMSDDGNSLRTHCNYLRGTRKGAH